MKDSGFLPFISKPGRYLGQEFNSTTKNWQETDLHTAFVFPDLYEIGMSHQGLQILYHLVNATDNLLAERSYCPNKDVEDILREKNLPLTSLESAKPLADFDMIGITLPYELCYTNILTILDLSHIPFKACDRDESHPLIMAGGAGAFNPEPVAEIFDAIILGDGEESIIAVSHLIVESKKEGWSRAQLLTALSKLEGLYIPGHFEPQYENDILTDVVALTEKEEVKRCFLADFDQIDHLLKPLVPNGRVIHDRLSLEIARGCTRGCRFCQAGITYRPVRERSAEKIKELAQKAIKDSGFEELSLLSLSTGDYSCLDTLLPDLMNEFSEKYVSVALPSLRVGTLSPAIMEQIKRVRKSGFTLAPEAGSDRLRRVINKGITEEALLSTAEEAFTLGWTVMKLYFMIGLPTETDEDIEAIAELVRKVHQFRGAGGNSRRSMVNVSVGTFVPKPHTPFQWAPQLTIAESRRKIQLLKKLLPSKGCNFKWHEPEQSYLEGVFSRGDRRLLDVMIEAWNQGARLDGWSEHFNLNTWRTAAATCSINMDKYLAELSLDAALPWQHLSTGVSVQFLKDELCRATTETYTPDCRYHKCQECGVCDFETIMPVVHNKKKFSEEVEAQPFVEKPKADLTQAQHFKYIVHYSRKGRICFLGHLEILQVVFRALRRCEIRTHFSQGYNPSPKVSFGPALSVGTESLAEYFIMDLPSPLKDIEGTISLLSDNLPPGLSVNKIEAHNGKIAQEVLTSYQATLPSDITEKGTEKLASFLEATESIWTRRRKGKITSFNARPLIKVAKMTGPRIFEFSLIGCASKPGMKPQDVLTLLLDLSDEEVLSVEFLKIAWQPL